MPVPTWIPVAATAAVCVPLLRAAHGRVFGRVLAARAAARRPAALTLVPDPAHAWDRNPQWAEDLEALTRLGFQHGETYTSPELPGVVVKLSAHPAEGWYAALHEHPLDGRWITIFGWHADGSHSCFGNGRPSLLDPRPGDCCVNAPRACVKELHALANQTCAVRPRTPADVASAAPAYARAWAEDAAWYRQHVRKGPGSATQTDREVA